MKIIVLLQKYDIKKSKFLSFYPKNNINLKQNNQHMSR